MNIPIQFMQAEGEFSVPGTRQTVNGDVVRRAVGRLPLRDRSEALDYMASGTAPTEKVAFALRRAIVELAEERRERDLPDTGKPRSLQQ
jgi:hypothetical protein